MKLFKKPSLSQPGSQVKTKSSLVTPASARQVRSANFLISKFPSAHTNVSSAVSARQAQTQFMPSQRRHMKAIVTDNFDDIIKTPYDEDMQKYKYRGTTSVHSRQEKIQQFIYEKKCQSKLKYSSKSRSNQSALPVPNGSVSIMLNVAKKDFGFNLQAFRKKIPARSKFKMKWKTIQWLLKNRQDAIRQIFENYHTLKKFARNKAEGMDREEFGILLSFVGLGADPNLAEKLFYVFDEDGSGRVDYKELIIGLEVLKEDTLEEKLKVFFDLCDEDGSGKVSETELLNVLKQNMLNSNDVQKLRHTIRQMIKDVDVDGDGQLDKQELMDAAKNNIVLRQIMEETFSNVKRIDEIIDNDLEEPFHQFVPVSANFVNYKEGIHYPTVSKIFDTLESIERIDARTKMLKNLPSRYKTKQKVQVYGGLVDKITHDDDSVVYD